MGWSRLSGNAVGRHRADYMESVVRVCVVRGGNFEVYRSGNTAIRRSVRLSIDAEYTPVLTYLICGLD